MNNGLGYRWMDLMNCMMAEGVYWGHVYLVHRTGVETGLK